MLKHVRACNFFGRVYEVEYYDGEFGSLVEKTER